MKRVSFAPGIVIVNFKVNLYNNMAALNKYLCRCQHIKIFLNFCTIRVVLRSWSGSATLFT